MSISRQEFFRQGFYSLGSTVLKAAGLVQRAKGDLLDIAAMPVEQSAPGPDQPRVATARSELCLARNSGCFSCVERCELQAISIVVGEGIRINRGVCNGCGSCEYVCPVTPKAIVFEPIRPDGQTGKGE